MIAIRSERELQLLRESGRIVAEIIASLESFVRPGITTTEIDKKTKEIILSRGARPAFKGVKNSSGGPPYPAFTCLSIDEQVVHGIPGDRYLEEGQIVSVDVGVEKNGYFGDAAWTFSVGKVSQEKQRLMRITEEALWLGIARAVEGNRIGDISFAIQSHVESAGYSVVRDLVGHGIGRNMHEEPPIPNFGKKNTGPRLRKGMVLAIEPMVNAGGPAVKVLSDKWTVVTKDGFPSAHFEHTVFVNDGLPEILTVSPEVSKAVHDRLSQLIESRS